jgi:hypothetical protein
VLARVSGLLAYGLQLGDDLPDGCANVPQRPQQRDRARMAQMALEESDNDYGRELHLHFGNSVAENVHGHCVAILWTLSSVMVKGYDWGFWGSRYVQLVGGHYDDKLSQDSMLRVTVQLMEHPERVVIAPIPCLIRLESLDDCLRATSPRIAEAVLHPIPVFSLAEENWESAARRRLAVATGQDPDNVIERGPIVVQAVGNEGFPFRRWFADHPNVVDDIVGTRVDLFPDRIRVRALKRRGSSSYLPQVGIRSTYAGPGTSEATSHAK